MSRKEARETVFKLIYERCVTGSSNSFSFDIQTEDFYGEEKQYIQSVYDGVCADFDFLSAAIQDYSTAFKLERVYKVDLAVMLVAAYEILNIENIAFQVSVNEAVEISKKYSTEKSFRFVNGILSTFIKNMNELLAGLAQSRNNAGFASITRLSNASDTNAAQIQCELDANLQNNSEDLTPDCLDGDDGAIEEQEDACKNN